MSRPPHPPPTTDVTPQVVCQPSAEAPRTLPPPLTGVELLRFSLAPIPASAKIKPGLIGEQRGSAGERKTMFTKENV